MSYILGKVKNNIKRYGLFKSIIRMTKKISHIISAKILNMILKKTYKNTLDKIISNGKYKNIIVQYPFFDFNMPNFQRFQQLSIALSKLPDTLVFYCTPNNIYDSTYGFKEYSSNLYITNQYNRIINANIKNRNIIFVSTDLSFKLIDVEDALKRGDKVIYDFVDDINSDIVGEISIDVIKRHEFMLKNEDIKVIATADNLYAEVEKYRNKNFGLVTNGVDVEEFIDLNIHEYENLKNANTKMKELLKLKANSKILIGYYGALASWVDYDLIKYIAKDTDIGIVLIGVDYDKTLSQAKLDNYKNILYLGIIEYSKLKYYANECDILTIPFKINEVTNSTSPVKLFEYMALTKPIITTDMPECRKYKNVLIAKDYEMFYKQILDIKNKENFTLDAYSMLNEARENSWINKATLFMKD